MSKLKLIGLSCMLALAALPGLAFAQYMYLDANGDGVNSSSDSLATAGPTVVAIYLNTNHDRDGTLRSCNARTGAPTSGAALDFFSYTIVLRASGGTVSWGTFASNNSAFTPLGTDLADGTDVEFTRMRPAGSVTPAGLVKLGMISVAVTSGAPHIDVGTSTPVDPFGFGTGFGTSCEASDFSHTYVLGTDWFDTDGIGPQSGGMGSLAANVPSTVDLKIGEAAVLVGEFSSSAPADSLALKVEGLPAGLSAVVGESFDQKKQLRAYGALDDSVREGTYDVTWVASNGTSSTSAHTEIRSMSSGSVSPADLEGKVQEVVTADYMPHTIGRSLGLRALPILAGMLRDYQYRRNWHRIAQAIGDIGDTSYFDTLRTFIRDRFQGSIDEATFTAIRSAQGSLSPIATISPRALDYLIQSSTPSGWNSIPWASRRWRKEEIATLLARISLVALAYTDSERANDVISNVGMPADTTSLDGSGEAIFVQGIRRVHADVRRHGFIAAWGRTDPRMHGGYSR